MNENTDDPMEIALVPRSALLLTHGTINVFEHPDEVLVKLDAHSPDEMIEFSTYTMIGDPRDLKLDPNSTWIERQTIVGIRQITRAAWNDLLRDQKRHALVPSMGPMILGGGG